MFDTMMCSISFDAMHVGDIGLFILGIDFDPFLNAGVIMACFQSFGTIPVSSVLCNMFVIISAISVWSSLSYRGEISSEPWALLGLSPVNNLSTPWTVMVIGGMGDDLI